MWALPPSACQPDKALPDPAPSESFLNTHTLCRDIIDQASNGNTIGSLPSPRHVAADVFGVGIILLEIGLWRPIRSIFDEWLRRQNPGPAPITNDYLLESIYFQRTIESVAPTAGLIYQKVVRQCLGLHP